MPGLHRTELGRTLVGGGVCALARLFLLPCLRTLQHPNSLSVASRNGDYSGRPGSVGRLDVLRYRGGATGVQLQPEVAMGECQGAGRQLLPRRSVVQLFGGEECGPSAETGLRVGAAGARAKEILPGFEAPAQRSSLVPTPFGPKIGRFRQNSELLVKNPRKRLRTRRQQDSLWSETRCNLHIHSCIYSLAYTFLAPWLRFGKFARRVF